MVVFWPGLYWRNGPQWDAAPSWLRSVIAFPLHFVWNGGIAVAVFFVLSGFVLSLSFFRGSGSLSSSAVRRYPRLMIPVLVSILFGYALMASGAMSVEPAARWMDQLPGFCTDADAPAGFSNSWLRRFSDPSLSPSFAGAVADGAFWAFVRPSLYNFVTWTMPIELLGSFVVFGTLAVFGRLPNRWIRYAAICVGVNFLNPHLIGFVLGIALCDFAVWNRRSRNWGLPLIVGTALLAVGWFCIHWKAAQGLFIVGAIVATPGLQRLLSGPRLAWLGRASFGIYLIHVPILGSLGCRVYVLLRELGLPSHDVAGLAACALTLAVSIVGALAFERFVDRPTLALTKTLDAWLFRPVPSPALDAEPIRRAA